MRSATAALQYSSRDVTVDRVSGRVIEGNVDEPKETTELRTFVRQRGGDCKLSAIQED
jgi:predicted lipid-binding transport protein (Tim44 family)